MDRRREGSNRNEFYRFLDQQSYVRVGQSISLAATMCSFTSRWFVGVKHVPVLDIHDLSHILLPRGLPSWSGRIRRFDGSLLPDDSDRETAVPLARGVNAVLGSLNTQGANKDHIEKSGCFALLKIRETKVRVGSGLFVFL
jgi:hypothetical protein